MSFFSILGNQYFVTRTYTASGTFVVPDTVECILASMCGGGGAGTSAWVGATGGGGGYVLDWPIAVTPGETLTITVGSGGNTDGVAGSSSTIVRTGPTTLLQVYGGGAALANSVNSWLFGGNGGQPNGAGGGCLPQSSGTSLVSGACGFFTGSEIYAYGDEARTSVNFGTTIGLGSQYGGDSGTGGSTPFPQPAGSPSNLTMGYGNGGYRYGSAADNAGQQGIVIIKYIGAV